MTTPTKLEMIVWLEKDLAKVEDCLRVRESIVATYTEGTDAEWEASEKAAAELARKLNMPRLGCDNRHEEARKHQEIADGYQHQAEMLRAIIAALA